MENMERVQELIQRSADARKAMQEARAVEEVARVARVSAESACEKASGELGKEIRGQVDALVPIKEGDRVF